MDEKTKIWNFLQVAFICTYCVFHSFLWLPKNYAVLPQVVFLVIICTPVLFVQIKLGGAVQKGIVGQFSRYLPIWKGVGIALMVDLLATVITVTPLVTYLGSYTFISITGQPYAWSQCDNQWNTNKCGARESPIVGIPIDSQYAEEEFFTNEFLQITDGIDNVGGFPKWNFNKALRGMETPLLPIAMAIMWALLFLVVGFGGRVFGWVIFVLAPSAIVMMLVVLGYGFSKLKNPPTHETLKLMYFISPNDFSGSAGQIARNWIYGFYMVMRGLLISWGLVPTIGKMAGNGKSMRNSMWLVLLFVYVLLSQVPPITIASFLGNLYQKEGLEFQYYSELRMLFYELPRAFSVLEVPAAYTCMFYLSAFLFGFIYLSLSLFVIVDNVMDALNYWIEKKSHSRLGIQIIVTFFTILLAGAIDMTMMTKAGPYILTLIGESVHKLTFISVFLCSLGLLIVYARQTFAIQERIILGMWFMCAGIISTGLFVYMFILTLNERIKYNNYVFDSTWDSIVWVIAAIPLIFIPIGVIHSILVGRGTLSERLIGSVSSQQPTDDERGYMYHQPEPSAPPYTFVDGYPLNEVTYKPGYDSDSDQISLNRL